MQTLYLCYFGLREPLVQTQVLPYLRELRRQGIGVGLLTFEPGWPDLWTTEERDRWENALARDGIQWRALRYHKRPSVPATLYDILMGGLVAARWARESGAIVFHARAHMAMAMALAAKSIAGGSTVFDFRGLVADEYVDAGVWAEEGWVYRAFKKFESFALQQADQVVALTRKMKDHLTAHENLDPENIEIIPCCVDFSRFDDAEKLRASTQAAHRRFTVVYAGSVTGLYLLEEMGRFFLALRARKPQAFFQILTSAGHEQATEKLRSLGIAASDFEISTVNPGDVPFHLARANVGLSFRKATFSQIAASPTKIPEYLAAGLPVISNQGVGDVDEILRDDHVGCIVKGFSPADYDQTLDELELLLADSNLPERCKLSARSRFDLKQIGGVRYRRVYHRIESGRDKQPPRTDPSGAPEKSPDAWIDREG